MMMMRPGAIPQHHAVGGAILALAMTMIIARVKRTCRAVRRELGKGRGPEMEMGNGRRPRTGRGRCRQQRKGRGMGRGTEHQQNIY
jgi:hypothetical protein